jgi:DNA-binding transcriptional regulator YiaG
MKTDPPPRHKAFSALILRWRKTRKLSQSKAAALFGVHYRTWQDWEYARRAPRGIALELITAKLTRKKTNET